MLTAGIVTTRPWPCRQPAGIRRHRADVPAGRRGAPRDSAIFCPMKASIEICGLRKRFGSTQALDEMTFTVGPGQVTGFVGPNGAGKPVTEL